MTWIMRHCGVLEEAAAELALNRKLFCSCSGTRLPDELVRTAGDVYVRFHGIKQWYRRDYRDGSE
ncbi:uncharacterized protein YecE (DUF72 family) [Rhizobium giardinii]|uniref:Uncharacterized protein YecE (DUF72 family) n=1 Tax=Rhizobium giardinii TaxID=56731 RepID=A0A7W8UBL2_9HYPH|nr:uncharacterized protein YecE (DUF72 family) [Rhizobium giardinii]